MWRDEKCTCTVSNFRSKTPPFWVSVEPRVWHESQLEIVKVPQFEPMNHVMSFTAVLHISTPLHFSELGQKSKTCPIVARLYRNIHRAQSTLVLCRLVHFKGAALDHEWQRCVIVIVLHPILASPLLALPLHITDWSVIKRSNTSESLPVQNMKQMRKAVCGWGMRAKCSEKVK